MAAEHVAGELIEEEHTRQRGVGLAEEMFGDILPFLLPKLEEALPDLRIEAGICLPPVVPAMREPEMEDTGSLIGAHALNPSPECWSGCGPAGRRCCACGTRSWRAASPGPAGHDIWRA